MNTQYFNVDTEMKWYKHDVSRSEPTGTKRNATKYDNIPVEKQDKEGNYLASYPDLYEAAAANCLPSAGIRRAALGVYNSAFGFKWKFKNKDL